MNKSLCIFISSILLLLCLNCNLLHQEYLFLIPDNFPSNGPINEPANTSVHPNPFQKDEYSLALFHLDEICGDTLYDETQNSFGILKGAKRVAGFSNNGILCTKGNYAIFDTIIPHCTKNGTVEFYFKLLDSFSDLEKYTFFGNRGSRIHVIYSDGTLFYQKNHDNIHKYVGYKTRLTPNIWYKIAVTWGSKGMRMFLNDELVALKNDTSEYRMHTAPFWPSEHYKFPSFNIFYAGYKEWGGMEGIGIYNRSKTYFFNGILDEIHISSIERY